MLLDSISFPFWFSGSIGVIFTYGATFTSIRIVPICSFFSINKLRWNSHYNRKQSEAMCKELCSLQTTPAQYASELYFIISLRLRRAFDWWCEAFIERGRWMRFVPSAGDHNSKLCTKHNRVCTVRACDFSLLQSGKTNGTKWIALTSITLPCVCCLFWRTMSSSRGNVYIAWFGVDDASTAATVYRILSRYEVANEKEYETSVTRPHSAPSARLFFSGFVSNSRRSTNRRMDYKWFS